MATPTIEAISTQDITIDTDYALEIGITGDPEEVTVGGLLEGFYYSWDAANDMLTIAGEATRLLGDAIWTVSAKETSSSTAVTREITYNVVSGGPIIEEIGEQTIVAGRVNDIFIEIQNKPTLINVDGLLLGLKYEPSTEEPETEGEPDIEGLRITGEFPFLTELTVDSGIFSVVASNDGGDDIYAMPFVIDNPVFYELHEDNTDPQGVTINTHVDPNEIVIADARNLNSAGFRYAYRYSLGGVYLGRWAFHSSPTLANPRAIAFDRDASNPDLDYYFEVLHSSLTAIFRFREDGSHPTGALGSIFIGNNYQNAGARDLELFNGLRYITHASPSFGNHVNLNIELNSMNDDPYGIAYNSNLDRFAVLDVDDDVIYEYDRSNFLDDDEIEPDIVRTIALNSDNTGNSRTMAYDPNGDRYLVVDLSEVKLFIYDAAA